jgi:hypothetical protein
MSVRIMCCAKCYAKTPEREGLHSVVPRNLFFVQTLAEELKSEKIEPLLCELDIDFGQDFGAKIEEGLRYAELMVLFWSPEAARSE